MIIHISFFKSLSKRIGELDYNEEEFLNCGAEYIENDIRALGCVVQTPEDEDAVELKQGRLQRHYRQG